MKKSVDVWCILQGQHVMTYIMSATRRGAIADFIKQTQLVEEPETSGNSYSGLNEMQKAIWKSRIAMGYEVVKCRLIVPLTR